MAAMKNQSGQIVGAIMAGASFLAISLVGANAAPRPGNAEFCPAVLQGIKEIVDDFGLEKMRPMVGAGTSPRMAAFLLDEYFQPLFGLTLSDIPANQYNLWAETLRGCREAPVFIDSDNYYGAVSDRVASQMRYVLHKDNLPPYRYYLTAVEAYGKADAYLQDGFSTIEPTIDGYLEVLKLQNDIAKELAIVRPSRLAAVFDSAAKRRADILNEVVAAEEQRLIALDATFQSLGQVAAVGETMPSVETLPEAEQVRFRHIETILADKAAEISAKLLSDIEGDEQVLVLTRDMLGILPARMESLRRSISEARHKATQGYVSSVIGELDVINDPTAMAELDSRMKDIFRLKQDQDMPELRQLVSAIQTRTQVVRQAAYKAGCTEHLLSLGIKDRMFETNVLASRGGIPFWQFMCAMHERNIRIGSFAEPGFFSSIYELKATLPNGDYVTLNMKETDAGADGKALVGVDIANAVDTTKFTLESWKAFVSQASGF